MGCDDEEGDELTVTGTETLTGWGSFLIERRRLERQRIVGEGNGGRWMVDGRDVTEEG